MPDRSAAHPLKAYSSADASTLEYVNVDGWVVWEPPLGCFWAVSRFLSWPEPLEAKPSELVRFPRDQILLSMPIQENV